MTRSLNLLEQTFSKEINKREAQLNNLRLAMAWLKVENDDLGNRNQQLELEKKDFNDRIKEAEKKFQSDMKAMARAHQSELNQIKEKYQIVTERALSEAKRSQELLDRTIRLRKKVENEMISFKEDLKERNIGVFKNILDKFGCFEARAIGQTFQEIEIFEDGTLQPNGKIVVKDARSWFTMDIYHHRFHSCYNCGHPELKEPCYFIRTP